MPHFFVEALDALSKIDGVATYFVNADDATVAKNLVRAQHPGDYSWENAVVTQNTVLFQNDLEGWRFRIRVSGPSGSAPDLVDISYVGVDLDLNDNVGLALVPLLNAHPAIAGAAYVAGTDILTVAAIGDNLGDRSLTVETYPPGAREPTSLLVGAIVHQGVVAAALTVVLTPVVIVPFVARKFGPKVA